ncbi:MAG: hypothetical protein U0235_07450 [Polyangiaceae bacterium]
MSDSLTGLTERCHPFAPYGGIAVAAQSVALARSLGASCVPQLEAVLAEGSDAMRAFAIEMLAALAPDGIEARARTVLANEALASEVRGAALATLAKVTSSKSLDVLLQYLAGSPALRIASEQALVLRADDKVVPRVETLLPTLRPGDKRREALARILGSRAEPRAAALLEEWIDAGDPLAREALTRAEPLLGGDEARAHALWLRALGSPDALLRPIAVRAVANADRALSPADEERLRSMFSSSRWPVEPPNETAGAIDAVTGRVLRQLAPDDAVECIASRLDDAGPGFARARAEGVLRRLSRAFVDAWRGGRDVDRSALPSPRWAELLPSLTLGADDVYMVGVHRENVARAIRFMQGERDPLWLRSVDLPTQEGEPLPFMVIGWWWYQTEPPTVGPEVVRRVVEAGFWRFHHQVGGFAVLQTEILGVPVRVPTAIDAAVREVCAGFETSGEPLDRETLDRLNALMSAAELPPFVEGVEALAASAPVTTHVPALERATRITLKNEISPWEGVTFMDETIVSDAEASPRAELARLYTLGREHGLGAPRVILLWGNSD